ncbi:hypothetical protein WN48_09480 [Eufriesea mexicana]|nr:hypothetical protein WN48_09480 [Eufriesea mexicana]
MYKCKNDWKSCIIQHDSGSESAPLLSSGSHTSAEHVIFQDSETSDLDYTPKNSFFKYGSLETCSLHSNITIVPKRPPPLNEDHSLITPLVLNASSSLNVTQDKCYEIHNTDLETIETTCKDIKSKQSSLVTM